MSNNFSRRTFIQTSVLATGSLFIPKVVAANPQSHAIKLGCCSWNFHGFKEGSDILPFIKTIGELGFDGIELLVISPADLETIWSKEGQKAIQDMLNKYKLKISRLTPFVPFFGSPFTKNEVERKEMFENLEKVCQVGKNLRVPLIGYIGWSVPGTNPNAYKLSNPKPNQKLTFSMPENTDWDSTWKDSVNMTKHFLRIVKSYGMKLSVEPHFNNIPQSNEQFIALKNEINDSALGCSFDTCWTSVQAAYPPLMVKMLGKHIDNVQFRDTDAETRNAFVPFGEGVIDFEAVVRTLKSMNYQGYITLEEVFLKPDVALVDAKNFLLFMKKVLEN